MQPIKTTLPQLLLASSSPRRRQLLEALGLPFSVIRAQTDEKHPQIVTLTEVISQNAVDKAQAGLKTLADKKGVVVIGADTLVAVEGRVLGKPKDPTDAANMLRLLSGRTHTVMTGVALASQERGCSVFVETSEVLFRPLSESEISGYVETKEPYDKAGSYAVQGASCLFIEKINGSYTNVMGLPMERLLKELEAYTGIPVFHWFPK